MGKIETHTGTLKKVNLEGKTINEYIKDIFTKTNMDIDQYDWTDKSDIQCAIYDLNNKYIILNNKLYEWLNHDITFENIKPVCKINKQLNNGLIDVFVQFDSTEFMENILEKTAGEL